MTSIDDILEAVHSELVIDFIRSSGPGGQNVNKVATNAQLRFDVAASLALPPIAKERLASLAGRRMTSDGTLIIEAKRHRTQGENRIDAIARLDGLLIRALQAPRRRVPTKASAASRERRLAQKKKKSDVKRNRQAKIFDI